MDTKNKEKLKMLGGRVPLTFFRRVKGYCGDKGISVQDLIIKAISKFTGIKP